MAYFIGWYVLRSELVRWGGMYVESRPRMNQTRFLGKEKDREEEVKCPPVAGRSPNS
jgi:hypothetical protein